jgi:hypothetical protein
VDFDGITKFMPRKKIPLAVIEAAYAHNAFKPLTLEDSDRKSGKKGPSRIMYIECKAGQLSGGDARIGRVTFSKTGSTLYYQNKSFGSLKGRGFKANYVDMETGDEYWISGPKKNGQDRLYGERVPVEIDDDVQEEYWTTIRNLPERKNERIT